MIYAGGSSQDARVRGAAGPGKDRRESLGVCKREGAGRTCSVADAACLPMRKPLGCPSLIRETVQQSEHAPGGQRV